MSVFDDFQRVWVQRFPESSLSTAWEEDVRASLEKHRTKVISLKEELDKEELYVKYLERLLSDVEKHREESQSQALPNRPAPPPPDLSDKGADNTQNDSSTIPTSAPNESNQEEEEDEVVLRNSPKKEQIQNATHSNQCVTELSQSLIQSESGGNDINSLNNSNNPNLRRCISDLPSPKVKTGGESDSPIRRISQGDASNFVTVIEVNQNGVKGNMAESGGKMATGVEDAKKKIPPRPPPKVFPKRGASVAEPEDDVSPTTSLGKTSSAGSNHSKGSHSSISERVKSYESISSLAERGSRDSVKSVSQSLESVKSAASRSLESVKSASQSLESVTGTIEPYYDSVPIDAGEDGEYVYIQAGGSASSRDDMSPTGLSPCSTLPLTGRSPGSSLASMLIEPESPGKSSNYVNIDYFIQHQSRQRSGTLETQGSSMDSDGEIDVPPPVLLRTISQDTESGVDDEHIPSFNSSLALLESSTVLTPSGGRKFVGSQDAIKQESERVTMYGCIINSIIKQESVYVEWLTVMLQYMKAIKATLSTSQPVISEDEFNTMFYKIPELHALHSGFLDGLIKRTHNWDGKLTIGDHFKIMARNINLYGAFLHNYGRAKDTVRKCSANNTRFGEITSDIRLQSQRDHSLSLEDLLHKPVARVQMNALVLHDLLKYTPVSHPDHSTLTEALNMTQHFLDEFNIIQTKSMFPAADRAQRRLVKNSFIVELSEGNRKLRHLFLFNDVIACAKYKASGRDKFTFELKWYIPLGDIVIYEEPAVDPKESSPANIVSLKSQACTVRDQLLLEEKDDKRIRIGNRSEKQKKKLADLEAQLVLASPNLVFRVGNKQTNKAQTFFLSSDFERTQWIESIHALQQCCQLPGPAVLVSMYELQAWITACRTFLKTNMGSYLMRSGRDESLLVGDLHLTIKDLTGLDYPADLFVCIEVDSYGHYFRKAKSKLVCRSCNPIWNETYVLDLEGSQNLRILLYEDQQTRPMLHAKYTHKLSRSWLSDQYVSQSIALRNSTLNIALKFTPSEETLRRVPTSKPGALFGAKIQQVCKREKRDIPFIVTSCIREVERRGMTEVGIYRVSGSATDLTRLKKSFESNPYEAEQLLKEVDIHSVTGILKLYLRELPEALFTDALYPKFYEAYNSRGSHDGTRIQNLTHCYESLPLQNKECIDFLLNHLMKINHQESDNKMSLHNLATVFGPTLLRPSARADSNKQRDLLAAGTVDVMAQAGILHCFLLARFEQINQKR